MIDRDTAKRVRALDERVKRLEEALKIMIVGAAACGVPNQAERAVLQEAVDIAQAALKEQP